MIHAFLKAFETMSHYDFVITHWGWSDDTTAGVINNGISKMLQRRFSPLAKQVFSALNSCIAVGEQIPSVFSSANGELAKCLSLLQTLQTEAELSPATFSLSVHNGIAGLFAMAYQNHSECTVLAPSLQGMMPAFLEALGMLHEGKSDVLLVFYDEPVSDFYPSAPFEQTQIASAALALKLALTGQGVALRCYRTDELGVSDEHLVQLHAFAAFLKTEQTSVCLGRQGDSWRWDKQ
jgi:hypothetical protein